jgi:glycine dehydrogenase subunit 1
MPFIPHTAEETEAMLSLLELKTLDDLFSYIPQEMRPRQFDLPDGLTEYEVIRKLEDMSGRNAEITLNFMGAGFYNHVIPAAVDALSSRGEFLTAYTPYQAEAAQGTLQAIFEYQTAVCRLFEMDIANASVYDGGSAIFEAAMMAVRATKRARLVIDSTVHPLYRKMLSTLTANLHLDIVTIANSAGLTEKSRLIAAIDEHTAAVIVQTPPFSATRRITAMFSTRPKIRAPWRFCRYTR